jgi:bacterioferritin-associated ferredoxin
MYVCLCQPITDRQIRRAVAEGAASLRDLRECLGIATGCGRCAKCARAVLKEALSTRSGCSVDSPFALRPAMDPV